SSTVKLPFLSPSSLRSRPSRPVAPSPSIQASKAASSGKSGCPPAAAGVGAGADDDVTAVGAAAPDGAPTGRCSALASNGPASEPRIGVLVAEAVTNGRLLLPANTVILLS